MKRLISAKEYIKYYDKYHLLARSTDSRAFEIYELCGLNTSDQKT